MKKLVFVMIAAMLAAPALARDSLGVFDNWAAFRDPKVPRCYAIASALPSSRERMFDPYVSIGTWPERGVRNQLHIRLSREVRDGETIRLLIARQQFDLVGGGGDAWARDKAMDAAIIAEIRQEKWMLVRIYDRGRLIASDRYDLDGAATAMDAATVGCARQR